MKALCIHIILLLIFCSACTEDLEIESIQSEPMIVIEGLITNESPPYKILIHESKSFNDELTINPVSDAEVYIRSGDLEEKAVLTEAGTYIVENITGEVNASYTIRVVHQDSIYEASSTMIEVPPIDSVLLLQSPDSDTEKPEYNVSVFFGRKKTTECFYHLELIVNDTIISSFTDDRNYQVFTDYYMNTIREYIFPYNFKPGDNVRIKLYSLTSEMFEYLFTLNYQSYQYFDYIHVFPKNLPLFFSSEALGYFQVSAVNGIAITIPE